MDAQQVKTCGFDYITFHHGTKLVSQDLRRQYFVGGWEFGYNACKREGASVAWKAVELLQAFEAYYLPDTESREGEKHDNWNEFTERMRELRDLLEKSGRVEKRKAPEQEPIF